MLMGAVYGALLGYLFMVAPGAGTTPPCPTYALTEVRCHGCGTLRAIRATLHGAWAEAWRLNPATFVALISSPLVLLGWDRGWFARARGAAPRTWRATTSLLVLAFLAFGVIRAIGDCAAA